MSLLETVEPTIWLRREDISWAKSGVANGVGQFSFVQRDGYDIPMTLFAPHKQARKELDDLHGKVESLLSQCRKEARKEAFLEAAEYCDELAKLYPREGIGFDKGYSLCGARAASELRRMAESDKTTMEGEK